MSYAWSGVFHPTVQRPPRPKPIAVKCVFCHYENRLERPYTEPQSVYLICHGCEVPLVANLTAEQFTGSKR